MSREIKGDLIELALEGNFDVIIHGCNCYNKMASGIAGQLARKFPQIPQADALTRKGDPNKLGTYSTSIIESRLGNIVIVINAYTQYNYGTSQMRVDYTAVERVFKQLAKDLSPFWYIGYPSIGAGLGGGDWKVIKSIIDRELKDFNHTHVIYNKED